MFEIYTTYFGYFQINFGVKEVTVKDCTYMTRPENTSLIYTKYTCSYYGIYLFFCVCYTKSVNFIEKPSLRM